MRILSQRLKNLRQEKNLTQTQLADIIGISRGALSLYETGKREPDYCTLQKFADFFNVSTDYLLGRNIHKKGNYTKIFSKRLKQERQQRKWSILEMSNKLDISTSQLSDYEKSLREPDLDLVAKIAKLLDISIDYLLGLSDNPKGLQPVKYTSENLTMQMILREDIHSISPEISTIIKAALKLAREQYLKKHKGNKSKDYTDNL